MDDLYSELQADHDAAWELMNALTGCAADDPPAGRRRKRLSGELVSLLSAHELSEEIVVWPAVRRFCPQGPQLLAAGLEQEHSLKLALNELTSISPSQEFDECVDTVAATLRSHFSYEQSQVWPRLSDSLPDGQSSALTAEWRAVRGTAATKPHPHLPADPKLLATLMPMLTAVDRALDAVRGLVAPSGA